MNYLIFFNLLFLENCYSPNKFLAPYTYLFLFQKVSTDHCRLNNRQAMELL